MELYRKIQDVYVSGYRIAEQATKSKFFWVDDVWVTGILGTVLTTSNSFIHELVNYIDTKAKCRHLKN
jgi:hypothetical protein